MKMSLITIGPTLDNEQGKLTNDIENNWREGAYIAIF